jgi:hypothetical protein
MQAAQRIFAGGHDAQTAGKDRKPGPSAFKPLKPLLPGRGDLAGRKGRPRAGLIGMMLVWSVQEHSRIRVEGIE